MCLRVCLSQKDDLELLFSFSLFFFYSNSVCLFFHKLLFSIFTLFLSLPLQQKVRKTAAKEERLHLILADPVHFSRLPSVLRSLHWCVLSDLACAVDASNGLTFPVLSIRASRQHCLINCALYGLLSLGLVRAQKALNIKSSSHRKSD